VPALDTLLADLTCGDDQRAEACIPQLAKIGDPALQSLLRLAQESDPDHRWWALQALVEFKVEAASDAFISALSDRDAAIRYCAALALRLSPAPKAISALTKALSDPDRLMARLAGDALIAIGEAAIPKLAELLDSSDPAVRGETARALAKMEIPEVIPLLYAAAEDPSAIVQYWIEEGFERQGMGMVYFKP
jgi:HEAT repeat protein